MSATSFTTRILIAASASRLNEPVAIGPVGTDGSLAKLRTDIVDAGWVLTGHTPGAVASYMTGAEWRRQHRASTP